MTLLLQDLSVFIAGVFEYTSGFSDPTYNYLSAHEYPQCVTESIMDIKFEARPSKNNENTWPIDKFPTFTYAKSPLEV